MIFLVSKNPMEAVQLQRTLKGTYQNSLDVYLSLNEVEENLYKLPDIIFIDENLELSDLISLTQSIKAYDPEIHVVWLCNSGSPYLEKIHKSYGVYHCLLKETHFLERISLLIKEIKHHLLDSHRGHKRKIQLKRIFLNQTPPTSRRN